MDKRSESRVELALKAFSKKRKPYTITKIAEVVFTQREEEMTPEKLAQFEMDFMLSGHFICCGEDINQHKLWDLKSRQPSSLMDKEGNYLDDLYEEDEDVLKNELSDDTVYKVEKEFQEDYYDQDDEEEDDEEHDDIEEELMSEGYFDDEADEIDEDTETDDIEEELIESK
jgi:DNA-directed RNA polymerase delta subunit